MEQLIAIVVFGGLIAVCVFGLMGSRKAARTGAASGMAFVGERGSSGTSGASSGRKTEDHATLSEVAEPDGMRKDETTKPAAKKDAGPERPQAERPLTSGDVGA